MGTVEGKSGPACPACGRMGVPEAPYCPWCGAELQAQGLETVKLATILFADIVGSTQAGESLPPDDARARVAPLLKALAEEIRAEGGTIDRFLGDAIMADFGIPQVREDDSHRAVRAARRLLTRLDQWNDSRPDELPIRIRIGINSGPISVGGSMAGELRVMGDTVNVAARLEQLAEPGTIVIGERTAAAVERFFHLTELSPQRVKGKSRPLRAWRVDDEKQDFRARGLPAVSAPMVGRAQELRALQEMFRQVKDEDRSLLVTVFGDAGIGKSRLLAEFADAVRTEATVVKGSCPPHGLGHPFVPFLEILRGEAGFTLDDPVEIITDRVRKLIHQSGERSTPAAESESDPQRIKLFLSSMGLVPPDESIDPNQTRDVFLDTWLQLLARMAADRRVVVMIEDLHWADDALLDAVEELLAGLRPGILIGCSARADLLEKRPTWGDASKARLDLNPLDASESAALLEAVSELPGDLKDRIQERAEGNPFFLEELIGGLIDEGHLTLSKSRWAAAKAVEGVTLPDTVQGVVLSRLETLNEEELTSVRAAAVVGRRFDKGTIDHLVSVQDVNAILDRLIQKGLLTKSSRDVSEFAFRHVLMSDIAYETIPQTDRAQLHLRLGDFMERGSEEFIGRNAAVIAHHFFKAYSRLEDEYSRAKARGHLLTASKSFAASFGVAQAKELGRRAVELSASDAEKVGSLAALGDIAMGMSAGDTAWECFLKAIQLAERDPQSSHLVAHLCAKAAEIATRFAGALHAPPPAARIREVIDQGLANSALTNRDRAMLLLSGSSLQISGFEEMTPTGRRNAAEAVAIAEQLNDPELGSAALDVEAALLLPLGLWGEIEVLTERRLELLPRLRDAREIGDAHGMIAWAATYVGNFAVAFRHASAGIESTRGRDMGAYLHGLSWRICSSLALGKWDVALNDLDELTSLQASDDFPAPYTLRGYAAGVFCLGLRGDHQVAEPHLQLLQRAIDSGVTRGAFEPILARYYIHRRDFDAAEEALAADKGGHSGHLAETRGINLEAQCDLVATAELWDKAEQVVSEALSEAERAGLVALPFHAERVRGKLATAAGQYREAIEYFDRSVQGFESLGAIWEQTVSQLGLAEVLSKAADDRAEHELARALENFERLGAVSEIRSARELVGRLT